MIFLPPTSLALGLQSCVTRSGKSFCLLSSLEDRTKSNLPPSTLSPVPNTILESVLTKQGTGWARKKGPTQSNDESVSWKSWRTSQIPQNTLSADRGQKTVCDVGLEVWVDHLHLLGIQSIASSLSDICYFTWLYTWARNDYSFPGLEY